MQDFFREFPSFVNAKDMIALTEPIDPHLCNMRKLITNELIKKTDPIYIDDFHPDEVASINVDLKTLNKIQITRLHYELCARGFRLTYNLPYKTVNFEEIKFQEKPIGMNIRWK